MRNIISSSLTKIHMSFMLILLLVILVFTLLDRSNTSVEDSLKKVDKLDALNELFSSLSNAVSSAETNQRGYLLTGHESYLKKYNAAKKTYLTSMDSIKDIDRGSAFGGTIERRLGDLLSARFIELDNRIKEFDQSDKTGLTSRILQENSQLPAQINRNFNQLKARLGSDLNQMTASLHDQQIQSKLAMGLCFVITLLAITLFYFFLMRFLKQQYIDRAMREFELEINREEGAQQSLVEKSRSILATLRQYMNFDGAAFYFSDENKYQLLSTLGFVEGVSDSISIERVNENLIFPDREIVKLSYQDGLDRKISFGTFSKTARHVVVLPLRDRETLIGFVELYRIDRDFDGQDSIFLSKAKMAIASPILSVSKRVQLEALLDSSRAQSKKLEHRSKALLMANEQLESSKKELHKLNIMLQDEVSKQESLAEFARKANEAKTKFIASISHDIRTPLNAIFGYAQLIEMDPNLNVKDLTGYSQAILRNGELLLALIDDVLDFSRIESGNFKIENRLVGLDDLTHAIKDSFKLSAESKNLDFNLVIKPSMPRNLIFDKIRVLQVINNLVSNSIKFTSSGHVSVKIYYDNPMVCVEVQDSGKGISEDIKDKIFEPFETFSKKGEQKGTGLGLAISRTLASKMNGQLKLLDSRVNEGSHFLFKFEAYPGERDPLYSVSENIRIYSQPSEQVSPAKVLIVDDSEENRRLLIRALGKRNVEIVEAEDGYECLDAVRRDKFHLILLDLEMPHLNGFQTVEELAARGIKTPTVAITASCTVGVEEKCLAKGFDAFMCKPIDLNQFDHLFDKMLRSTVDNKELFSNQLNVQVDDALA